MSEKSTLSSLETAIQRQLEAEDTDVRILKQIRWELSKIPEMHTTIDDVERLAEICLRYIELIVRFVDNSTALNSLSFALCRVEVFKYFNPLLEIARMRGLGSNFAETSANLILDRIVNDPSLKNLCGKGILHYLTIMIQNVDTSVEKAIANSHSQIFVYKLADMLTVCGDYEYQTLILEVIIRMMSWESIASSADQFFPDAESLQHALVKIDRNQFDKSSRIFLNTLNAIHSNVFSIVADTILLDKTPISGPLLGSKQVRQKLWVDFNKNVSTIGIFCDRDSLRTAPPSEDSIPASCFGWELITISCADIKDIRIKRLESGKRSVTTFSFEMQQQLHVLFLSSEPMTHSKHVTLWVSCEKDAQKLKSEVLPKLFPSKYASATKSPSLGRSTVKVGSDPNVDANTVKPSKSIASDSRSMKSLCDYVTLEKPQRSLGTSFSAAAVSRSERTVRQLSPDSTVPEVKDDLFESSSFAVREEYYRPPQVGQGMKVNNKRRLNVTKSYHVDIDTYQDLGLTEDDDDEDSEIVEESLPKSVLQEIEAPLSQELTQEIENNVKLASDRDGNKENLGLIRMIGVSQKTVDRMLRGCIESTERKHRQETRKRDAEVPTKQKQVARRKIVQKLSTIDSLDSDLIESTPTEKKLKRIFSEETSTKTQTLEPGSPKTTQEVIDILSRTPEPPSDSLKAAKKKKITPKTTSEETKITPKNIPEVEIVETSDEEADDLIRASDSLRTQKKKKITPKTIGEGTKITPKNIPEGKTVEKPDEEADDLIRASDSLKTQKKKKITRKTIPEETKITPKIITEEKIVEIPYDEADDLIQASDSSKPQKKKKITPKPTPEDTRGLDDESAAPISSKAAKKKKITPKSTTEETKITPKIIPEVETVETPDDESDDLIPSSYSPKPPKKTNITPKTITPKETIVEKPNEQPDNSYVVKLDEFIPISETPKKLKKKKITPKTRPEENIVGNIVEEPDEQSKRYVVKLDEVVPIPEAPKPLKPPKEKKKSPPVMDPFVFEDLSKFSFVAEEQDLSTLYLSRLKDLETEVPQTKMEMLSKSRVKEETKVRQKPKKRRLYQAPEELELSPDTTNAGDNHDKTTDATQLVEKTKGPKTRRSRKAAQEKQLVGPETIEKPTKQTKVSQKEGQNVQLPVQNQEVMDEVEIPTEVPRKTRKRRAAQETRSEDPGTVEKPGKELIGSINLETSQKLVERPKAVARKNQEKKIVGPETLDTNLDNYEIAPERSEMMIAKSPRRLKCYGESENSSSDEGPKIIITTVAEVHVVDHTVRRKIKQLPNRKVNYRLFPSLDYDAIELADDFETRERTEKNEKTTTKDVDINATSTVVQQPARFPRQASAVATTLNKHLAITKSDNLPDSPGPTPRKKRKYTRRLDKKSAVLKVKKQEELDESEHLVEQSFQQYLTTQFERGLKETRKRTNRRKQIDNNWPKLHQRLFTPTNLQFDSSDDDLPGNKLERSKLKAQRRKSAHRAGKKLYPSKAKAKPQKYMPLDYASILFDKMDKTDERLKRGTSYTSNLTPEKYRFSDAVARYGGNEQEQASLPASKAINPFKKKVYSESSSDLPELEVDVVKKNRLTPEYLRTLLGSSDKEGAKSPPSIVNKTLQAPPMPLCDGLEDIAGENIPDENSPGETISGITTPVTTLKRKSNGREVAGSSAKRPRIHVLQNIILKPADNVSTRTAEDRHMIYRTQVHFLGGMAQSLNKLYEKENQTIEEYKEDMNVVKDIVGIYNAYQKSAAPP